MDGIGGKEGWRWIFIIEGALSVLFGIITFFFLPDTPMLSGKWLNERQQRYLVLLNRATRGSGTARSTATSEEPEPKKKKINWHAIRAIFSDHHIYLQAIIFMSNAIPSKFLPPRIGLNDLEQCLTSHRQRDEIHYATNRSQHGVQVDHRTADVRPTLHRRCYRYSPLGRVGRQAPKTHGADPLLPSLRSGFDGRTVPLRPRDLQQHPAVLHHGYDCVYRCLSNYSSQQHCKFSHFHLRSEPY